MSELLRSLALSLLLLASQSAAHAQQSSAAGQRLIDHLTTINEALDRFDNAAMAGHGRSEADADVARTTREGFDYLAGLVASRGWVTAQSWGADVESAGIQILAMQIIEPDSDDPETTIAFAKSVLPDLLTGVRQRGASADGYAIIVDQIELMEGRPQIYGAHFTCRHGRFVPHPLREPERLDERRAEIGLGPIAQHRYSRNTSMQEFCALHPDL